MITTPVSARKSASHVQQGRRPNLTAPDVAKYFLAKTSEVSEADEFVSHLKLQKLLYYAQGFHLAMTGSPLFEDEICAWQHGPVVPNVWEQYKGYGRQGIEPPTDFDLNRYDAETQSILEQVWTVYGQFSAWKLRDLTHTEPPWKETPTRENISHAKMMRYFKNRLK